MGNVLLYFWVTNNIHKIKINMSENNQVKFNVNVTLDALQSLLLDVTLQGDVCEAKVAFFRS